MVLVSAGRDSFSTLCGPKRIVNKLLCEFVGQFTVQIYILFVLRVNNFSDLQGESMSS
jgi:glycerol uptake facilitator-like aquaporin